jgi:hypothetical protein
LAVRLSAKPGSITIRLSRPPDPRIQDVRVYRGPAVQTLARGSKGLHFVCRTLAPTCVDRGPPRGRRVRYVVVVRDRWGSSVPFVTAPLTVPPG